MTVVDRLSRVLDRRLSRRSFVVRSAFAGSALATGGLSYLLQPGTAYGYVCTCGSPDCSCGSTCCAGYTEFCCVLNGGYNSCPSDTVMGGWWMAEGSAYCSGPRYYMDCNATCRCSDGCGGGWQFCDTGCDGLDCGCAGGSCDNYLTGCFQFRYGQCNQDVSCLGRIKCRVVTCVPPWEVDPSCTTASASDDGTADQTAACLGPDPTYPPPPSPVVAVVVSKDGRGYGLVRGDGQQYHYGDELAARTPASLPAPVVAMASCPTGGFWLACRDGAVLAEASAPRHGGATTPPDHPVVAMATSPALRGYWLVTSSGQVLHFGDAAFHGGLGRRHLDSTVVAMAATPTGRGYWLAEANGTVHAFGDAHRHGDAASARLGHPVVAMAATPTGRGYWLATSIGRVLGYGDAGEHGGTGRQQLSAPIVAMAATQTGRGYYLAAADGGVFTFGDAVFRGAPAAS